MPGDSQATAVGVERFSRRLHRGEPTGPDHARPAGHAWALVLCPPAVVPAAALAPSYEPVHVEPATPHSSPATLCAVAEIGIPEASQLQSAQPLLTLVWSVPLLGKHLTVAAPLTATAVLVCIAAAQRARG